MRERRAAVGPGKYSTPVAGGPSPQVPILSDPRLNELAGVPEKGGRMTLEDAAEAVNRRSRAVAPNAPQNIFSPSMQNEGAGLLATDILPEDAMKDPNFIQGQGSMFAIHQPNLARKYGVIRNKKWIPPQQINQQYQPTVIPDGSAPSEKMKLSPATEEGLRAAAQYTEQRRLMEEQAAKQKQDAPPPPTPEPAGKKYSEMSIEEKLSKLDAFDQNKVEEFIRDNDLNTKAQKDLIEKRIKDSGYDLSIDEMVMTNKVRQRIPIKPGKFEVTLESIDVEVDLALKHLIMEEAKKQEVSEKYYLDKYSFMAITVSLVEIQGSTSKKIFPSCFDEEGRFNRDLFWKKWDVIVKLNFWMAASICTHFSWFDQRVQQLYRVEDVKNG